MSAGDETQDNSEQEDTNSLYEDAINDVITGVMTRTEEDEEEDA